MEEKEEKEEEKEEEEKEEIDEAAEGEKPDLVQERLITLKAFKDGLS